MALLTAWALAFGCMVGWGCFVMPGDIFLPAAGPLGTTVAMTFSALSMLLIAANYHYMMNRYPGLGGSVTYTGKLFGYDHAFLCSWFLWLSYIAMIWANANALPLMIRRLFPGVLTFGVHYALAGYDIYLPEAFLTVVLLLLFAGVRALISNIKC